jgi:hypothetical protein
MSTFQYVDFMVGRISLDFLRMIAVCTHLIVVLGTEHLNIQHQPRVTV